MSAAALAAPAVPRGARTFLAVGGAVLGVYGLLLFADPTLLGRLVGLTFVDANAPVEIRAFYGGLELGLAGFFVLASRRAVWLEPALVAFALAFGAAGAARLAGIAQFGFTGPSQPVVAAIELAGAVLALWLRRGARGGES